MRGPFLNPEISGVEFFNRGIYPGIENLVKQPMATEQTERQLRIIGFIGLCIS